MNQGIYINPYGQATPQGYQMPNQARSAYDYAKALMSGSGQQPVHHWTQGLSNMVSALVGGNLDYQTAQKERGSQMFDAGEGQNAMLRQAGQPTVPPPYQTYVQPGQAPPFPAAQQPEGGTNNGDAVSRASQITSGQESGGNYRAIGPKTRTGDVAYGKYQVMGENVGPWTTKWVGRTYTPQEFLADPEAQEKVYRGQMGEYIQKYGADAGKAWIGGEHWNPNARATTPEGKPYGPTVSQYGSTFASKFGQPQPQSSSALAFDGAPSGTGAPAAQAIDTALAANKGTGAPTGVRPVASQNQLGTPLGGGGPIIDPRMIHAGRSLASPELRNVIGSNYIPADIRSAIVNKAMQENQPIQMPVMGGNVIVDPNNPNLQYSVPTVNWGEQSTTSTVGPITDIQKSNIPQAVNPNGSSVWGPPPMFPQTPPQAAPVGPKSEAAPAQSTNYAAENKPQGATPSPETKVASLNPAIGSEKPPQQGQAETPPQQGQTPLTKFAQAGPPPESALTPTQWNKLQAVRKYEAQKEQDKANIEADKTAKTQNSALNAKKYDALQQGTQAAYQQMDNLKTAYRQLQDPNFYSGLFANEVEGIKKLGQLFGGDPNSSKPMEVFRKTMAAQIASSLKSAYGGLGQIRNKEIELSEKSNGSLNNSLPANLALVEIARRNAQRVANLGEMAQDYRLGRAIIDPVSGQELVPANVGPDGNIAMRNGLDPVYDKAMSKFITDHPMFSAEEYKNWDHLFDQKSEEPKAQEKAAGNKKYPPVTQDAINELKTLGPNFKSKFEEIFGPGSSDKALGGK